MVRKLLRLSTRDALLGQYPPAHHGSNDILLGGSAHVRPPVPHPDPVRVETTANTATSTIDTRLSALLQIPRPQFQSGIP